MSGLGRSVLVVDDHPEFLQVTDLALNIHGFDVICVNCAHEAIDTLRSRSALDFLLTDVLMPEVDGIQLAHQALALNPGLKIGLMSIMPPRYLKQYLDKDVADFDFIGKPCSIDRLVNFINRSFDAAGPVI